MSEFGSENRDMSCVSCEESLNCRPKYMNMGRISEGGKNSDVCMNWNSSLEFELVLCLEVHAVRDVKLCYGAGCYERRVRGGVFGYCPCTHGCTLNN